MSLKNGIFFIATFFILQYLFAQDGFQMKIKVKYFQLVEKAYHEMENYGIDLSEYEMSIHVKNNIIRVRFFKPDLIFFGSPPEHPILNFEINIKTGEILNIYGER